MSTTHLDKLFAAFDRRQSPADPPAEPRASNAVNLRPTYQDREQGFPFLVWYWCPVHHFEDYEPSLTPYGEGPCYDCGRMYPSHRWQHNPMFVREVGK